MGAFTKAKIPYESVKDEMRRNLIAKLRAKGELFPGVIGYDRTVIPALVNAILSRHNFILLGLRGQAKTRIIRALVNLLDPSVPSIDGSPLNCHPLRPSCAYSRRLLREGGDDVPVRWIDRGERYQEKLATPDVTIADLIGDLDPIKAARERRDFADEESIHYGIIPRTNRGIFAINELPDLQPRIQVGLLNILEENDLQIRGYPVRIPLDMLLVFTANPEDYTNRGNIITPLKDRIDSQIITHYPTTLSDARRITDQEAWTGRNGNPPQIPAFYRDVIEEIAFVARESEFIDQSSGVSARLPIAVLENVVSNVERRNLLASETSMVPRMADLSAAIPAITGKVELVYEGEREGPRMIAVNIIGRAVGRVFERHFPSIEKDNGLPAKADPVFGKIIGHFVGDVAVDVSDEMPFDEYQQALLSVPTLKKVAEQFLKPSGLHENALGMEFVLDGLHQKNLIARTSVDSIYRYTDMLATMLHNVKGDD
ncbi:MAG: magnesium chelatase [candidate division Zixibacteria bacterium]|nr:magnesium chelatase [candidate division Zixibacteria bacterium]